ncbi:uncharacterized protein [Oscarella lobularis]|uniref:uncharacterized protein n=1 Tax=Oscarella lobularis TaxID=121494 RepID=UPI0033136440
MSEPTLSEQVKLYPHVNESQLACWGLGRGIKATEPKRLMQVVARPVPVDETTANGGGSEPFVEETRVGTGYSELTFCVSSKTELTRKLSSTLLAPLSKAVSFECGCSYEKSTSDSETRIAVGHQIRNRTYTFRLHAHDEEKRIVDPVGRTFVEDCILKEYGKRMQSREGDTELPARMPELNEATEESVSDCERAIKGPLGGVTHFVVAIDMGGKVYREITTSSSTSTTSNDASFATTFKVFKAASELRNAQNRTKTTYTKSERVLLHPDIIGKPLKRDLKIKRDEEVVVCLRVLPIASLVKDPAWAESMRSASRNFIDEELQRAPMTHAFYLKAGQRYVRVQERKLRMTNVKKQATPVYIEPLPLRWSFSKKTTKDLLTTPGALFLLAFKIGGQRFYLCTSSRDKYEAIVSTHLADKSGGQFSLCHPGTNQAKALEDWLTIGLLIEWKSGFFSRHYLQLPSKKEDLHRDDASREETTGRDDASREETTGRDDTSKKETAGRDDTPREKTDEVAQFLRRDDSLWKETDGVAQFQLENACQSVMEEGSQKEESSPMQQTFIKIN